MTPSLLVLLILALFDIFLTFWCFVILEQRDELKKQYSDAMNYIKKLEEEHRDPLLIHPSDPALAKYLATQLLVERYVEEPLP